MGYSGGGGDGGGVGGEGQGLYCSLNCSCDVFSVRHQGDIFIPHSAGQMGKHKRG